jgi:hypothetical protein
MSGLLLLATIIGVVWLAIWSIADPDKPSRRWSPFDMRDDTASPPEPRGRKWQPARRVRRSDP